MMTLTEFFKQAKEDGITESKLFVETGTGLTKCHVAGFNSEGNHGWITQFKIDVTVHGEEVIV
jgi:hypothetical protein